jgi:hypothetical protein
MTINNKSIEAQVKEERRRKRNFSIPFDKKCKQEDGNSSQA